MHCPNCNANLEGGLIYEHFLAEDQDEERALTTAAMYGATKTTGRWGKAIGIYDLDQDRTVAWRCPECNHEWSRDA